LISLRCALLVFVVVTLILAPAAMGQTEASMTFQQVGTAKMPFNVKQPIAYKVQMTNEMSATMTYGVELEVGPDYTDYSISKKYTDSVSLQPKSSEEVTLDVNFMSPEMSRGAFGEWATDENDTSTWEKAWYKVSITPRNNPFARDPFTLERYDGQPGLIKMITVYKNAEVSPKMGTNDTLYSYRIDVFSSSEDVVALQAAPEAIGPWMDLGSQNYTNVGNWQTLRWENVSLDFDFIGAHYRFVGRKTEAFEGPFWPVDYEYKDSSVDPADGFSGSPFTYVLDFKGSKNLDVGLNIWDIDQNQFKLVEKKKYSNATRWQRMEWTGVMPSETIGSEGTSSYYFSFYYPESESPLGTSREDLGKVYMGPEIVLIKYENAFVSPERGGTVARYTYSVDVSTALPVCDIELQTSEPGSSLWRSQGIATYNGDPRICWKDVSFDGDVAGNVSYRFIRVASPPTIYQGPKLIKESITGTVIPARGVMQVFPDNNNLNRYVYTIRIENLGNDSEDEGDIWVELLVKAPNSVWKTMGERKQYASSNGNVSWVIKPFTDVEFLGSAEYKFLINGVDTEVFRGPEIVAMYKNLDYEDVSPGRYNYVAWVNGSVNLTADLIYSTDNENWKNLEDWKRYTAGSGWTKFVWGNKPGYRFFEVDIRFEEEVGPET
jgi:hypothetical protein